MSDKPNKAEALQFINANFDAIEAFVGGDAEFRQGQLVVATPHGALHVRPGDWIVRSRGKFYSCSSGMLVEFMGSLEKLPDV